MAVFNRNASNRAHPYGDHQLRRAVGRSKLYDYLKRFATRDVVYTKYDFTECAAIGDYPFTVANSGGSSSASFTVQTAENGTIQADTGTDDDGSLSIIGKVKLFGDRNAGMEARVKFDVMTDLNFEVGLLQAAPGSNAGGVSDEDTPTLVAGDKALFALDTDETYTGLGTYTIGSTANQDAARTSIVPLADLTAAQFYRFKVQLIGNSAFFFFDDELKASHDLDPQGNLEGGVAVFPWVYCRTRSAGGVAVFPEIDYIETWHDRN